MSIASVLLAKFDAAFRFEIGALEQIAIASGDTSARFCSRFTKSGAGRGSNRSATRSSLRQRGKGRAMLLAAEDSILLVVDIQERLMPSIAGAERVAARAGVLLGAARILGVPVLASEQYPRGLGRTVPDLRPDEVVEKIHFSCAAEPGFLERIQALHRRQVVLCGAEAHVCVLQTALGLRALGYDIYLAADATGSRDPENRALALSRMMGGGVRVVSTEMVLFEWMGRAGTPVFKEILPLIR
jgi:nicotinamidase-related amidase